MRSIWSGLISFGLLYIPVRMYNATESHKLEFNLLRRSDLCPIQNLRVCAETGEVVPYADIVRGYEYAKGQYVVLEDEDFERANPRKTHTIDLISFVDADEVDEKYLEKPYYLEPDQGASKAYYLLREALNRSGKAGLARFVLRTREYLGLLKAEEDVILFNRIRFADEIREPEDLDLPKQADINRQEIDMAVRLIEQLSEPWRPEQYHDTYEEDLKRIIEEKIRGEEPEPVAAEPYPVEVTDLFTRLSESVQMAKEKKRER